MLAADLGPMLREAREAVGFTLAEISERLRIRLPALEAIEAGRYDEIPNAAYRLGYVSSYAAFLGYDREAVAEHFKQQMTPPSTIYYIPQPGRSAGTPSREAQVLSALMTFLVFFGWHAMHPEPRVVDDAIEAPDAALMPREVAWTGDDATFARLPGAASGLGLCVAPPIFDSMARSDYFQRLADNDEGQQP